MSRYFYVFGYNTPDQSRRNDQFGWDDEDSAAVIIEAESEDSAREWGQQIAEEYVKRLFGDQNVSWRKQGFADRVERIDSAAAAQVSGVPFVERGHYPDWEDFVRG